MGACRKPGRDDGIDLSSSFTWKTRKFQLAPIIPFGVLLKFWASGQSDAFLLLLLGFKADVHTLCMSSIFCQDKLNHFVFMPKISIRVVCVNGKHHQFLLPEATMSKLSAMDGMAVHSRGCPQ